MALNFLQESVRLASTEMKGEDEDGYSNGSDEKQAEPAEVVARNVCDV